MSYGGIYYGQSYSGVLTLPNVFELRNVKDVIYHVYDPSGTQPIHSWHDITTELSYSWPLNSGPGAARLTLLRHEGQASEPGEPGSTGDLYLGNVVKVYVVDRDTPPEGVLVYQGVIDHYAESLENERVEVTLVSYISLLFDTVLQDAITLNMDPTLMAKYFLNYVPTLRWDESNPLVGVPFTATFGPNEKLNQVYDRIQKLAGGRWFYRLNPDNSLSFNYWTPRGAPGHSFMIGKELSNKVRFEKSALDFKHRVIVVGAGGLRAIAALPDIGSTATPRDLIYSNQKITDANTAARIASSFLEFYSEPTIETQVEIIDDALDPQKGHDLEHLRPGDTISIVNPSGVFAYNIVGDNHIVGDGSVVGGGWHEQVQKPLVISVLHYTPNRVKLTLRNRSSSVPEELVNLSDRLLLVGG